MGLEPDTGKNDNRTLLMLLFSIVMCGAELSFDAPLVVKVTAFYGITDSDFGLLLGLTTFVIAAASAPWGYWADKYQRIRLILISQGMVTVCMLLGGLCLELSLSYKLFFAIKLSSGIGLAAVGPVATAAVMDTVSLEKRGAVFGWVGVSWILGGALGMLLPSICMAVKLSLGITYLIGAVIGLGFTFALLFVKEPRRGSQDEALKSVVGEGKAEYAHYIKLSDLWGMLRRPVNLLLVWAMIFFQFPGQVLAAWFITYLMRNHGQSEFIATQLMFLSFLGAPFGNAFGGAWSDRAFKWKRSGRVVVMIVMALFTPVFLGAAMLLPFRWLYFAPLMIVANFFMAASGPGLTTVSLEVNLPEHRGSISALMSICSSVVRALAWYIPPLIAAAFGGRYDRAFLFTAAAYLPLAITYFLMSRRIEKDLDYVNNILVERAREL